MLKKEFKGNPIISEILGFGALFILFSLGVRFILLWNIKSIIVGLVIVAIVIFVLSKFINKVLFLDDEISIKFLFGNKKLVKYKDCRTIYKSNDGLIKAPINVIRYKSINDSGKITFVCGDDELRELCDLHFGGHIPKDKTK